MGILPEIRLKNSIILLIYLVFTNFFSIYFVDLFRHREMAIK